MAKKKHEHHGGAWKVAYADFVTSMMALFLLASTTTGVSTERILQQSNKKNYKFVQKNKQMS